MFFSRYLCSPLSIVLSSAPQFMPAGLSQFGKLREKAIDWIFSSKHFFQVSSTKIKFYIFFNTKFLHSSFDLDPTTRHTWFSLIIGGCFTYLTLYACNQTQVQRLLTVNSLKASQKAVFLNWPILSLLSISTSFSGLAIYSYYAKCDPVKQGRINSYDQVKLHTFTSIVQLKNFNCWN